MAQEVKSFGNFFQMELKGQFRLDNPEIKAQNSSTREFKVAQKRAIFMRIFQI
jgi:hypothetical protein